MAASKMRSRIYQQRQETKLCFETLGNIVVVMKIETTTSFERKRSKNPLEFFTVPQLTLEPDRLHIKALVLRKHIIFNQDFIDCN